MPLQDAQLQAIGEVFGEAERRGMPLWLDGGWAIDAQLGRITRAHSDIDLGFPEERGAEFRALLQAAGFAITEETGYGFLATRGAVLLDCEHCVRVGDRHEAEAAGEYPENACPAEKNGMLAGIALRCMSWEKMFVEFLFLARAVPRDAWEEWHLASLAIVEAHVPAERREKLRWRFAKG
jgi:2''-aminoglycoside nucleotidyltransferase